MTRVLLFGASGFIGAHVRSALAADPRVAEVLTPGRAEYDLVAGDVDGLAALLRATGPDAIVSCVGALGGTATELLAANTLVASKLLEAAAEAAPRARLVRMGSAGEYGVVEPGRSVREDDPLLPVGAYGVSHVAGTRLFAIADGLDAVSLRVFNPIGPGMSEETLLGRAAARIRAAVSAGEDEIQLGPLGAHRDFVDVRDLAALVGTVVLARDVPSRIYNAGSGRAVTAREAVALLAAQAGWTGTIREAGTGPSRSAAVTWIRADVTRARDELGWTPVRELETTIKDVWNAGERR
ncbi:NAD-dependent epimerase/dehydratase family protein [Catenuloplanes atrovinosus]|uniref:Nucleoside-diphosphate-sugar epimerase n=1 Tax=Catenuloplanes atrovinosus TaxID=137266 RepID=A0AAE3YNQ0_9ACTN|nr:NAD(P)-dependent oxidoreductase [Catenuloplanes atrovinosus]MDR7275860.1 nucleoside-diphosphate-sugar epimerase [Catenuloplanes atrovinosus]